MRFWFGARRSSALTYDRTQKTDGRTWNPTSPRPLTDHSIRSFERDCWNGLKALPAGPQPAAGREAWLRGRPANVKGLCHPFLKLPGSRSFRTLPDGLWLNFGGTPVEPYVDVFAIEACGTLQNLLDKRSRFAASTSSLMAVCPMAWMHAPVQRGGTTPRWMLTGLISTPPTHDLVLPVRDLRVMYGLTMRHYRGFSSSGLPQAHEYFVPMDALLAKNGDKDPAMQALVGRASAAANFFDEV